MTSSRGLVRFSRFRWSTAVCSAAVLAISALAAGCDSATASQVPGVESANVSVDVFPTVDFAGLYIAQMDGLFRQQGLNVTITFAPASQLAVTSIVNGTSDISGTDYVTYVDNELNNNARLRIIAEASSLEPNALGLFVPRHSPITTLAGLRGHTIGVTSADDIDTLLVRALLAEDGISSDSVNIQFGFQLPNISGQLNAGQASAAPIPEPFASEGQQQYGLEELADVDQGATTDFPLEGYAVTQAWAQKNPGTVAAFERALAEGQEIADTNRRAFEAAVERYLDISPVTAAALNMPEYPVSVSTVQLQRVVDAMVEFGMLPESDISFKMSEMTG
jgi:NitT/TauT family transport system substrate-binding protein